ncbi:ankyrin repeat domain-containing protein 13B [Prunus yedoensis var. nudiflora]|uniref:Ankyrin repeat domain-containing protein 13B n=1 Tax=Prunus yedoensis var. nudiflora TaxID=2094558 RepID=A0A315AVW7_PRUYE|nr:ankyrin repeat domain-containing protein 13B [Prunus yedoensis var. nudiflora]
MEISFHFESSVIPFVGKIAPSDTYKIWKRDGNLRADTSLAGFDGLKIQRADQSFLFLGDGDQSHDVPSGSLLVLNRDDRKIFDAFENAGSPMSESDIAGFCSQTSVFRSRKVANGDADVAGSEQVLPLELDEDDDGFLVAENPSFGIPDGRRHSSFVREDREFAALGRKSVDVSSMAAAAPPRRSMAAPPEGPWGSSSEKVHGGCSADEAYGGSSADEACGCGAGAD